MNKHLFLYFLINISLFWVQVRKWLSYIKVFFTLKSAVFLFVLFIIITCILFFLIHLEVPFCWVCYAADAEREVLEKSSCNF